MKRIYLLFCALTATLASFAQTVPGGDMETWRNNIVTNGTTSVPVAAPVDWYGSDSLFLGLGLTLGGTLLMTPDSVWHAQLFEENDTVHSGSHSAKLITTYQDTVLFAGTLSNAQAVVHISFSPPGISGITFFGGTPVTDRPTTVSAWIKYYPGKDSATHLFGGVDTAVLSVVAISRVGGTIGRGLILIGKDSSWTQVTANVVYTDTFNTTDTLRITFSSSGGATQNLDSSILYVDDVTMTSIPQVSHEGVKSINTADNVVKVYPNPTAGTIYLDGPQNAGLICTLLSVNGQVVLTKALAGTDALDVSDLPGGTYFYNITDSAGKTVQRGNVAVNR